jgi:cytoskeleton protein RodZ
MSSEQPDSTGTEPEADSAQPADPMQPADSAADGPGALLLAERREQGLSLGDVARQLKLSVRQVEALERDEYAAFPGPVFVRGFLRNYAKLLQLDPEALVAQAATLLPDRGAAAHAANPSVVATPVPLRHSEGRRRGRFGFGTLGLGLVLVIVVLAAIYDSRNKPAPVSLAPGPAASSAPARAPEHADSPPPSPVATDAAPAPAQAAPASTGPVTDAAVPASPVAAAAPSAPAVPTAPAVAAPAVAAPAVAAPAAATPAAMASAAAPAAAVSGVAEIKLDFADESWVEIKDGTGTVIFARLNPAGVQQVVSGAPPLDVVIGNAGSVRLTYRSKPIDLVPHTRVDVARVRLE